MTNDINAMFCRQCQETFGNSGCTKVGVCGKHPVTAGLMDELVARLEDLAAVYKPSRELGRFMCEALFMTLTNANFDDARIRKAVAGAERRLGHISSRKVPRAFSEKNVDARSLKEAVLFGLKGIAAYSHHAAVLGREDEAIYSFVFKALKAIGEPKSVDDLVRLVLECGQTAVSAMALLDAANTAAYGTPSVTRVCRVDLTTGETEMLTGEAKAFSITNGTITYTAPDGTEHTCPLTGDLVPTVKYP